VGWTNRELRREEMEGDFSLRINFNDEREDT
jgi:hypothetical protein